MKNLNLILIFFFLSILLSSCNSFKEAGEVLRNEKVKTTDEFLVKKRGPLTEPPDFSKIPEPGSLSSEKEEDGVKKILKMPKKNKIKRGKASSAEDSILRKIRK